MKNVNSFLENRYDPIKSNTLFYENDERISTILKIIRPSNKKINVLDIGCYDGYISKLIKDKIGNCDMYGIDYSNNTKELVEEKGIIFKKVDLNKGIDYPENFFDYIFAGEIIEHMYDTDFFISEVKRVLKPSGLILITTPNLVSLGRRIMYLLGIGVFMEASLTFPDQPKAAGHLRFFTHKLLEDFMKHNNFKKISGTSDTLNLVFFEFPQLAKLLPGIGRGVIGLFKNLK